jgi:hypothetical protein
MLTYHLTIAFNFNTVKHEINDHDVEHDSLWPVDLRFGPAEDRVHLQRYGTSLQR